MRSTAFSWLVLAACSTCQAGVVSVTGSLTFLPSPPPYLNTLQTPGFFVWNELQGVTVTGVYADAVNSPWDTDPIPGPTPIPGYVSGVVDSHRLMSSDIANHTGTVRFSGRIVAVLVEGATPGGGYTITDSDPLFALPGMVLGTRGDASLSPGGSTGAERIRVAGDTLYLNDVFTHNPGSNDTWEMRVLTEPVPSPASAVVLGAGLVLARRRRGGAART